MVHGLRARWAPTVAQAVSLVRALVLVVLAARLPVWLVLVGRPPASSQRPSGGAEAARSQTLDCFACVRAWPRVGSAGRSCQAQAVPA